MFTLQIDDDLRLRLLEERHADGLFALIDANREHLDRWFPWVRRTTEVEHSRDFIRRALRRFADGNGFECALYRGDRHVGMLGTHFIDWTSRKTELGYWLARDAEGGGIMSRAVQGLSRVLFDDHGLRRVEIRSHVDNVRSRAVPERLGFTHEGVMRSAVSYHGEPFDLAVYSLLSTDAAAPRGGPAPRDAVPASSPGRGSAPADGASGDSARPATTGRGERA